MTIDTFVEQEIKKQYNGPDFSDPNYLATIKVEAAMIHGLRKFFDTQGFTEVTVPHLTYGTGSCENVDTVFEVSSSDSLKALLSQTGQLYLEPLIKGLGKVCCLGPSFRAEDRVDTRHLVEFPLGEIEFSTAGDDVGLEELMIYEQKAVHFMAQEVLESANIELKKIKGNYGILNLMIKNPQRDFPSITYNKAIKELGLSFGSDLKHEHELRLIYLFTNNELPLFVTHYPKQIKFFNMAANTKDDRIVNSVDMLVPFGGEAAGGAERTYKVQELIVRLKQSAMLKQLRKKGLGIEVFDWYIKDMARRGSIPHAGCGFGLNRIAQYIMAKDDIRSVTAYPLNKKTIL